MNNFLQPGSLFITNTFVSFYEIKNKFSPDSGQFHDQIVTYPKEHAFLLLKIRGQVILIPPIMTLHLRTYFIFLKENKKIYLEIPYIYTHLTELERLNLLDLPTRPFSFEKIKKLPRWESEILPEILAKCGRLFKS